MNVLWLPLWEPQLSTSPRPQDEYQLLVLSCALCRQGHATKASFLDFRFVFPVCNFCFLNPTPSLCYPRGSCATEPVFSLTYEPARLSIPPNLSVSTLSHFFLITLEG